MSHLQAAAPPLSVKVLRDIVEFIRGGISACPQGARTILPGQDFDAPVDEIRMRLRARVLGAATSDDVKMLTDILCGSPYKVVADNAAVSLRHAFRRRDQILGRVGQSLANVERSVVRDRDEAANLKLEMASRLIGRGYPAQAEAMVEDLIRAGVCEGTRALALATLSRAACDQRNPGAATGRLQEAKRYDAGPALGAEILSTQSFIEYRQGFYATAIQLAEAAVVASNSVRADGPITFRRNIAHLHYLAVLHEEGGSAARAVSLFETARRQLYSVADPPRRLVVENLAFCSIARTALPGTTMTAWSEAREAVDLAAWHGLDREHAWANLAFAIVANEASRFGESVEACRTAIAIARECLDAEELCRFLNAALRIETNAGNIAHAKLLLPNIQSLRSKLGDFLLGITLLCEARFHEAAKDSKAARLSASEAIERLEKRSESHYIGLAYTSRALTAGSDSRTDISAAIGYLRKGGSTSDLARALDVSARLTKNERHRREALELRAAAAI